MGNCSLNSFVLKDTKNRLSFETIGQGSPMNQKDVSDIHPKIAPDDEGYLAYTRERMGHWNAVARKADVWVSWGKYYHQRLNQIYQFLVAPGQRVLEVGCGRGDLLASLEPSFGVGVDFSNEAIQ